MTTKQEFMRKALGLNDQAVSSDGKFAVKAPVNIPKIAPFADWDYYYLLSPIGWKPEGDAVGLFEPVEAPRGFVTNLASIPKILWPVMPPTSRYTHAAIIHDFLYWTQSVSRSIADEMLRIGMSDLNVPEWKVSAIYEAVNIFGGVAWKNNAKLKEQGENRFLREFPKDPTITWEDWKSRSGTLA